MKFKIAVAALVCGALTVSIWAQDRKTGPAAAPKDAKQKVSYALGLNTGKGFKRQSIDIDVDSFMQGMSEGIKGLKPAMTEEQIKACIDELVVALPAIQAAANQKEGAEFLAKNQKAPGVVTLKSGLQYKVLKEGKGKIPMATDSVVAHYKGTLLDGTEFDSSYKRGEPTPFEVGGVIKGWTEALELMKVGSKWQLFIPSDLAYGPKGQSGIPPSAVLVFEIELLEIQ